MRTEEDRQKMKQKNPENFNVHGDYVGDYATLSRSSEYPWTLETMRLINDLTPDIHGKAFDPDWFLLWQRFEQIEDKLR